MTDLAGVVLIVSMTAALSLAILAWATWRLRQPFPVRSRPKAWRSAIAMLAAAVANILVAATSPLPVLRVLGLGLAIGALVVAGLAWRAAHSGQRP